MFRRSKRGAAARLLCAAGVGSYLALAWNVRRQACAGNSGEDAERRRRYLFQRALASPAAVGGSSHLVRLYRSLRPALYAVFRDAETAHSAFIFTFKVVGLILAYHRWLLLRTLGEVGGCKRTTESAAEDRNKGEEGEKEKSSECIVDLSQELWGTRFESPLGIAAGLDKNADLWPLLWAVPAGVSGVGFAEFGSVSWREWPGNAKPRCFRLKDDHAAINSMGLNNKGTQAAIAKLSVFGPSHQPDATRAALNITKTPDPSLAGPAATQDVLCSYEAVCSAAAATNTAAAAAASTTSSSSSQGYCGCPVSYVALNVSCPNTAEGKTLEHKEALAELLSKMVAVKKSFSGAPAILVKFSPLPANASEADRSALKDLAVMCAGKGVDGFIAVNTVPDRDGTDLTHLASREDLLAQKGGLSGWPIFPRALKTVALLHSADTGLPIVAVGGVSCAKDAFDMIRAGASLVQVYTRIIYDGPFVFRDMHDGLLALLHRHGYKGVAACRGVDTHKILMEDLKPRATPTLPEGNH